LFQDLPASLPDELFSTLIEGTGFRVERIVSQGHSSPEGFWYDQTQHEWIALLKGAAILQFENKTLHLKPGDSITIRAHQKHRVAWTPPHEITIWLAIHYDSDRPVP
jgi:cupin 2 domain-containing protein